MTAHICAVFFFEKVKYFTIPNNLLFLQAGVDPKKHAAVLPKLASATASYGDAQEAFAVYLECLEYSEHMPLEDRPNMVERAAATGTKFEASLTEDLQSTMSKRGGVGQVSKAAAQRELVKLNPARHSTITGLLAEGARAAADADVSASKYLATIARLKLARDALALPATSLVAECVAMQQHHPDHSQPAEILCGLCRQDLEVVPADVHAAAYTMLHEKHPDVAAGHAGVGQAMAAAAAAAGAGADLAAATASLEKALELDRNNLTAIVELAKMASAAKNWTAAAELASRGIEAISVCESEAGGQKWWSLTHVALNFVLGKASLQRLHTQSQAERAFQASDDTNPAGI